MAWDPFFAIYACWRVCRRFLRSCTRTTAIDGAGKLGRFRYVTVPMMLPILLITLVLSIIWTFSDFQAVYSLTKGGPLNSTHVLGTLSYQVGLQSGKISEGVAISLTMLPLLLVLVVFRSWYLRRVQSA